VIPVAPTALVSGGKVRVIAGDLFPPVIAADGRDDLTLRQRKDQVAAQSETAPPQLMMFVAPSPDNESSSKFLEIERRRE
jgi:hypothetical protein